MTLQFFATCARGAEFVLAEELLAMGAGSVEPTRGGVQFGDDLGMGYRACLWSRVASRVLFPLATVPAKDAEALYEGALGVPWHEHLGPAQTFAVHAVGRNPELRHSRFVALKVKDAVVDRIRGERGARPSVDTDAPDLRLHVHISGSDARLSLDLSGPGLHRRGLTRQQTDAPLRETLAASLLFMAGWPAMAAEGRALLDPMCGSGTLLIEAAWMATDTAPGLRRDSFGFLGWRKHDRALWSELRAEAKDRRRRDAVIHVHGRDAALRAFKVAKENIDRAGLSDLVSLERGPLRDAAPLPGWQPGLLITNPPYGERLGQAGALGPLYETLGNVLRRSFGGWTAAVLSGNKALERHVGLKPETRFEVSNGSLPCRLLVYPIREGGVGDEGPRWRKPSPEAEMFSNRIRKNLRKLQKWARKNQIGCYRLYDADIPEYNVAVDVYGDSVHVQEYAPPARIDPNVADRRLRDVRLVLPELLGIEPDEVFLKVRDRGTGGSQYGRFAELEQRRVVNEGPLKFEVNLSDYLDTGVFLDHRKLRARIMKEAAGKKFLNLFAYTCTASVAAAAGGAAETWSVDLSKSYLGWGRRNFLLNDLDLDRNQRWQGDWGQFLRAHRGSDFDLVYLGPPTFSKSKDAPTFDLQRDHPALLHAILERTAPGGAIYFGAPSYHFTLDKHRLRGMRIQDVSREVLPRDFARIRDGFHVWKLTPDRG